MRVDGWLPHIVLEPRAQHILPMKIGGARPILEGDFNHDFRVSLVSGAERQALRILTPDVMEFFQRELRDYVIEFVDHEVIVYKPGSLPVNEEYFAWIFYWLDQIQREVGKQAIQEKTEGVVVYDEDIETNVYIPQRVSRLGVIIILVVITVLLVVGMMIGMSFQGMLGLFFYRTCSFSEAWRAVAMKFIIDIAQVSQRRSFAA